MILHDSLMRPNTMIGTTHPGISTSISGWEEEEDSSWFCLRMSFSMVLMLLREKSCMMHPKSPMAPKAMFRMAMTLETFSGVLRAPHRLLTRKHILEAFVFCTTIQETAFVILLMRPFLRKNRGRKKPRFQYLPLAWRAHGTCSLPTLAC